MADHAVARRLSHVDDARSPLKANGKHRKFDRLAPRQRQCLRLIYDRKRTKEIAQILDLSPGTISGYVADAVRLLDAKDRIDAAEQFAEFEKYAPTKTPPQSSGVDEPLLLFEGSERGRRNADWRSALPIRLEGVISNELGAAARVLWIIVIAISIASGFGMLAIGLRTVSDLVAGQHAPW